jgi:HTH-type transcriptional regulator/antitoxin HigA
MSLLTEDIRGSWRVLCPFLSIGNEREYDLAIERLNTLIDEVGTDENHPLYGLLDTLGMVIHRYEKQHYPVPESNGIEIMQFLIEEHDLKLTDLPEIGTPEVILAILEGRQDLTLQQIKLLAMRFQVSPAVFI